MVLFLYNLLIVFSIQLSTLNSIIDSINLKNGELVLVYFDKTAFCQGCFDIDKNSVLDALKQIKNKRYCKQIKVLSVVDCSREIEFKNYQKKFSFLPYSFWNKGSLYEDLNIPKTTAVVIFDAKLNVLATFDYSIRTGFSKDIYKIIQNYFKINNNIRSQN